MMNDDDTSDDNFIVDFEMVLTDGRVFNRANATADVTRTGVHSHILMHSSVIALLLLISTSAEA